ncbi:expressed unknown protein [Seminavis robusta]|uniref:Uncharacterized protein n=1 Tax=Seminavis robusta TaxID=568900 RepID=A0A9N8DNV7_9STRA|nr:expressed unknown protein [Seminavis robusta]|eukprot:Sro252_g099550.1 n/a (565) ;mRNA; f:14968-16662
MSSPSHNNQDDKGGDKNSDRDSSERDEVVEALVALLPMEMKNVLDDTILCKMQNLLRVLRTNAPNKLSRLDQEKTRAAILLDYAVQSERKVVLFPTTSSMMKALGIDPSELETFQALRDTIVTLLEAKPPANIIDSRKRTRGDDEPAEEEEQPQLKQHKTSDAKEEEVDFTLLLSDHQRLPITKSQSEKLQESCAFFRNAFRHGTKECQQRIIAKPDWTLEVAKSIVELTLHGKLPVPTATNGGSYAPLKEAADQILLPIRVSHPISGRDIREDCQLVQLMAESWKAAKTVFTMDMTIRNQKLLRNNNNNNNNQIGEVWGDLLTAGTVFVDSTTTEEQQSASQQLQQDGIVMKLTPSSTTTEEEPTLVPPADMLSVGSFAPLSISIYHTCVQLSNSLRNRRRPLQETNNRPACMAMPLYLGGKQWLANQFPDLEFLTIEANNVPNVLHMTRVTSEFTDLQKVLRAARDLIAPVNLTKLCYLLVPDPDVAVLGKLIRACQACPENPGTIGWDLEKNQFCTLKTLRDTQFILDTLANTSTSRDGDADSTIRLINVDMTSAPAWLAY